MSSAKPVGTAKSFGVGGTMYGTYAGNAWTTAQVGKNVAVYWGKYGNTWNGTKSAPPKTFAPSSCWSRTRSMPTSMTMRP